MPLLSTTCNCGYEIKAGQVFSASVLHTSMDYADFYGRVGLVFSAGVSILGFAMGMFETGRVLVLSAITFSPFMVALMQPIGMDTYKEVAKRSVIFSLLVYVSAVAGLALAVVFSKPTELFKMSTSELILPMLFIIGLALSTACLSAVALFFMRRVRSGKLTAPLAANQGFQDQMKFSCYSFLACSFVVLTGMYLVSSSAEDTHHVARRSPSGFVAAYDTARRADELESLEVGLAILIIMMLGGIALLVLRATLDARHRLIHVEKSNEPSTTRSAHIASRPRSGQPSILQITLCNRCNIKVVPTGEGLCPSCRLPL